MRTTTNKLETNKLETNKLETKHPNTLSRNIRVTRLSIHEEQLKHCRFVKSNNHLAES